jgi:hypothetical protein
MIPALSRVSILHLYRVLNPTSLGTIPYFPFSVFPSVLPSISPDTVEDIFCILEKQDNGRTCKPFRSREFCPIDESFPFWIQQRAIRYRNDPAGLEKQGYWYHVLEDKVNGHLFTRAQNFPSPRIFCSPTNVTELYSLA